MQSLCAPFWTKTKPYLAKNLKIKAMRDFMCCNYNADKTKLNDFHMKHLKSSILQDFNTSAFQALQRKQVTRPSASIGTNLFKFKTDTL